MRDKIACWLANLAIKSIATKEYQKNLKLCYLIADTVCTDDKLAQEVFDKLERL